MAKNLGREKLKPAIRDLVVVASRFLVDPCTQLDIAASTAPNLRSPITNCPFPPVRLLARPRLYTPMSVTIDDQVSQ